MIIFLIIILVLLAVLIFLDRKLKNPYKLYLILGNKGTGKTAYMATLAHKYKKKGYKVYSNFDLMGLSEIIGDDYYNKKYEYNSVLFIDETGLIHDNRSFKSFPKKAIEFYKYQRKRKLIIYLSSQSVDIDKKIRDLVDYHILLRRFLPIVFPIYYHKVMKVEKQLDTGGLEIIDTLTTGFIPIKFSDIFILNFIINKYDTNEEIKMEGN